MKRHFRAKCFNDDPPPPRYCTIQHVFAIYNDVYFLKKLLTIIGKETVHVSHLLTLCLLIAISIFKKGRPIAAKKNFNTLFRDTRFINGKLVSEYMTE